MIIRLKKYESFWKNDFPTTDNFICDLKKGEILISLEEIDPYLGLVKVLSKSQVGYIRTTSLTKIC